MKLTWGIETQRKRRQQIQKFKPLFYAIVGKGLPQTT